VTCQDPDVTVEQPWFIGSRIGVVERPEAVDEAVDRNDEYAGVALVLHHPDPEVARARIKQALTSPSAQTRANALQSVGHHACSHGLIDRDLLKRLRSALGDRAPLHRSQIRGYAFHAASDVGMFVRRRDDLRGRVVRCASNAHEVVGRDVGVEGDRTPHRSGSVGRAVPGLEIARWMRFSRKAATRPKAAPAATRSGQLTDSPTGP
jgi:hypothetical protein